MDSHPRPHPQLVIRGCDVLSRPGRLQESVDITIQEGRVVSLAPADSQPLPKGCRTLDARGLLAIPGLINAHTHSPENCLRGVGEGLWLEPWLCRMFAAGGVYEPEDHYVCALAGAVEMLLTGTTACVDHLWMTPPRLECVEAVLKAYKEAGIRAGVAPLMSDTDCTDRVARAHGLDVEQYLLTSRAKPLPASELVGQLEAALKNWHGAEGGRLTVLAGPSGVQWCSDGLLQALAGAASRHGSGVHLHLLETSVQDEACRLRFGASAVVALDRLGILGPRCSLAHAVWLDDADIDVLAERGAVVVHNPAANLRLASGRAPVRKLRRVGVRVALGTDGAASSDNQVLWDAIKLAALIHHDFEGPGLRGIEVLDMAMGGGAAVLGPPNLGILEEGTIADLALLDLQGAGLAGVQALEAGLALSEDGRGVRHVIVDGRPVVLDGRCLTVDQDAVLRALRDQAAKRHALCSRPSSEAERAIRQAEELRRAVDTARKVVTQS